MFLRLHGGGVCPLDLSVDVTVVQERVEQAAHRTTGGIDERQCRGTGGLADRRGVVTRGAPAVSKGGPSAAELDADARLVDTLAQVGCQGPLWVRTAHRLAALGIGTLNRIILEGRLETESAALGRPIRLRPDELATVLADDHQREELVHEAVVKALDLFRRRTVLGGVWTTTGGARLDTYFVNGCVMALANPVRAWLRAYREAVLIDLCAPDVLDAVRAAREDHESGAADPVDALLEYEDTAAVLEWLGPVLGNAAFLRIHTGWSWREIAPAVGLSPKALERRLHHFRDSHDPREFGANHD